MASVLFCSVAWGSVTFDFESALWEHGKRIEGQTIGGFFTLSSDTTGLHHLGAAVFDSNLSGTMNPDLQVGLGNMVILQNNRNSAETAPGIYDVPDDDPDGGIMTFLFTRSVQVLSMDLIAINDNTHAEVVLTDINQRTRRYLVPRNWTCDICVSAPRGYDTLDLTTLAPQRGEGGTTATASEQDGFDAMHVQRLAVTLDGTGGIDNLVLCIMPSPGALLLCSIGTIAIGMLRQRQSL